MKKSYLASATLSLSLAIFSSAAYSTTSNPANNAAYPYVKSSLMGKSLLEQPQDLTSYPSEDDIKFLSAIRTQPTQNFFANQHQKFSRFVQALFPNNS